MCLSPIRASLPEEGGRPNLDPEGNLKLPCGTCHMCISKRSIEWAQRARHEISERTDNCFITLTYSNEHLPSHFIIKKDFQDFMKRLRKKLKIPKNPFSMKDQKKEWLKFHSKHGISYMVSYEYGSETFRPHMHAIIFGYSPKNQEYLKTTNSGSNLYTSQELNDLWEYGFHSIGEANEATSYYIASYALKGKEKDLIHPHTGEYCTIKDTMDVSKRPSIGLNFFMHNAKQLVDSKKPLPRYYVKKLEEYFPELFDEYYQRTQEQITTRNDEETYAKLIIDSQKMSFKNYDLRGEINPKEELKKTILKNTLKSNRDNYVAKSKEI